MKLFIRSYLPWILIIGIVLFSFIPTFYEWTNRYKIKPLRHFELVHNFPTDYNLYLSKIRQGKEGAWLAKEKYTSEPHEGSLSQILYVGIGRISDLVKIQTPYMWFSYHVMRFFFAILLLFVIWKICSWVFTSSSWRIVSFLLVVTASTWPKFEMFKGWPIFGGYMPWYTVIDSLQRTTFMPHVLMGQALLAFIIWVFCGGFITKKTPGNSLFLGLLGIILGIVFPPALLFLYGMLALWTVVDISYLMVQYNFSWKSLKKPFIKWSMDTFFMRAVFVIMTFPTMVYYALLFSEYPWKRLVEFDVINPTKFSYIEYFLALGPTLLFGVIGIIVVLLTRRSALAKKMPGFIVWTIAWLMFIFVFNFIPQQSPTRFSQMTPHIPLGILTAYLAYTGIQFGRSMRKKLQERKKTDETTLLQIVFSGILYGSAALPILIILFAFGSMYSSWLWQKEFVDHKLRADYPLVPKGAEVMYPMKDIVEAMIWLQNMTPRSDVVFSGKATGNLIPVYSGNTVHAGHANTVDGERKEIVIANVYGRKVPLPIVEEYFREHNIKYVFFGPEELELAYGSPDLREFYPFLEEVYRNNFVVLYKVNL